MEVRFHRLAAREYQEARAWYERRRPGLGSSLQTRWIAGLSVSPNIHTGGPSTFNASVGFASAAFPILCTITWWIHRWFWPWPWRTPVGVPAIGDDASRTDNELTSSQPPRSSLESTD
jgi:hypothetical protein